MPAHVNTEAMGVHLAKIALAVAPGAHAGVVLEGTRWHGGKDLLVHSKITLIVPLPYSFDLNPFENVWQGLRANKRTNAAFDRYDKILGQSTAAWNLFANDPAAITAIMSADWATVNIWGRWSKCAGPHR